MNLGGGGLLPLPEKTSITGKTISISKNNFFITLSLTLSKDIAFFIKKKYYFKIA